MNDTAEYWNDIKDWFNRDRTYVKFKPPKKHFLINGKPICGADSFTKFAMKIKNITCKGCIKKIGAVQ